LWLSEQQRHVEGEGGEQAHIEQDDHDQVPLPGDPLPVDLLLKLNRTYYCKYNAQILVTISGDLQTG